MTPQSVVHTITRAYCLITSWFPDLIKVAAHFSVQLAHHGKHHGVPDYYRICLTRRDFWCVFQRLYHVGSCALFPWCPVLLEGSHVLFCLVKIRCREGRWRATNNPNPNRTEIFVDSLPLCVSHYLNINVYPPAYHMRMCSAGVYVYIYVCVY